MASGMCRSKPSATWTSRLADNRPRAVIQMATGSGKTFTAVTSSYRLIKFGKAKRILFLVDRNTLGKQALNEFQQYISPYNNYKFTEEYPVQRLHRNTIDPAAKVCITTIQRLYSILKGEEEFEEENEEDLAVRGGNVAGQRAVAGRLQSEGAHRDVRLHHHRRVPSLDLQRLAAGVGILRCLPDRT